VSRTTRTQGEDTGVEEMKHGSSERGTAAKWWTVHGRAREDRVAIIQHDNATTLRMELKMWINEDLRVTKQGGDDRRQGGWRVVDEQQSRKGAWQQLVMVDTGAEISLMSSTVAEKLGWTWMPVPASFPVRSRGSSRGRTRTFSGSCRLRSRCMGGGSRISCVYWTMMLRVCRG